MSGVVERRRRRGADRRRRRCWSSVLRSGGEAQEAEGQGRKTMVWGKKDKFTPTALFICLPGKGRGDGSAPLPRPFLQ
jgi:hypothetical protein